jgi:hypothetical protein
MAQSITTINNTDPVSNGPTVLNANFQSLLYGKLAWAGPYSGGTTYKQGDVVSSGGVIYISLVNSNAGNTPASSPSAWVVNALMPSGTLPWGQVTGAPTFMLATPVSGTDLGGSTTPFRNIYFYGGGTFGANNFEITGTASAARTLTLPDANSNPVQGIANPSDTNYVNYIGTDGVQHRSSLGTAAFQNVGAFVPSVPGSGTDLGASSTPFRNLYLYGGGTFGANNFQFTGTASAPRTFTLPDANSNPVQGIANPSDTNYVNYIGTDGVQHRSSLGTAAFQNVGAFVPSVPGSGTDLGASSTPFRTLYLYGGGTFGANNFQITGTASAARTLTLPDANSNPVQGIADPTDSNVINYIGTDGVQHRIAQNGGANPFTVNHTYTYTSGTLNVDFSSYSAVTVTPNAGGVNPSLTFTAPTSNLATPVELILCNFGSGTPAVWTLTGAVQVGAPIRAGDCVRNPINYNATTSQFEGPGGTTAQTVLDFTTAGAPPSVVGAAGTAYVNNSATNMHYKNPSGSDFGTFKTGVDANPDTGNVSGLNGTAVPTSATLWGTDGSAKPVARTLGCGLTLSTNTVQQTMVITVKGGNYTVVAGDCGALIQVTATATITLPQAGTTGFPSGWFLMGIQNTGSGTVTVQTSTSTFYGAYSGASFTLAANYFARPVSDATNWDVTGNPPSASGNVTSVATSCGLTGGTITTTGTVSQTVVITVKGGNYTVVAGDCGALIQVTATATITLPQAGTTGFSSGFFLTGIQNKGSGTVTVQTSTSTFYGAYSTSSFTLAANYFAKPVSDGTNWDITGNPPSAGSGCTTSGSNKQVVLDNGSGGCNSIDFPDTKTYPAANCDGSTGTAVAGAGWSLTGNTGAKGCRAGTNNKLGYVTITDTSTSFAQFLAEIPADWDTATNPYIAVGLSSTDTTNGHTIIPQIQISCPTATNGTANDDATFATAHSFSASGGTITIGASAVSNGWYTTSIQMNSTDTTGCVAGSLMIVQVGRATDTATSANFSFASITWPRKLVLQAN